MEMKRQLQAAKGRPVGWQWPACYPLGVLFLFPLALWVAAAQTPQIKPTKRVLVFNEFGVSVPVVSWALSEFRSALYKQSEYKVDLFDESLDTSLFPEESSQQEIRAWYINKYRDKKPDIMVALGPAPIKFLAESRATFFPDVPIVFCGSSPDQAGHPKLDSHFTGAWMTIDPAKTIEAALRLQPGTNRVVVVGGVAPFDRGVESFVKSALRSYESRLALEYLTDLDMPTLLDHLRHLPEHSIVFYTSLSVDAKEQSFINATQSVPMVARAANAPVYGMADTFIGQGVVGGFVSSYAGQVNTAVGMIREILDGAKPADIPVVIGTNAYMFDWRALQRWGLDEKKLPIGSTLYDRQPGVWELYKTRIIGYALAMLALVLLSGYLLFERTRRRRAEVSLQASFEFEKLISELSTYFIDMPANKIDAGIDEALNRLRVFLSVDRVTMFEFSADQVELYRTHHSSGADMLAPDALNAKLCPWYFSNFLSGKPLFLKSLNELPAEAKAEQKLLERFGVKSNAIVPMESERTIMGSLSFVTVAEERTWSEHIIHQLPTVGSIFANALLRKSADEARASSELLKRAADLGDDLHSLSHRLHSSTLENLGLTLGLSSLCQEFTEQQGIQVDFAHENISRGINPNLALCIFRIVQEALRNVKKHSGSNRAEVRLRREDERLYLSISDAGIGFDKQQRSNRAGLGIRSMEERLRLVGGRIEIVSERNRGTILHVCLPCKETQESVIRSLERGPSAFEE